MESFYFLFFSPWVVSKQVDKLGLLEDNDYTCCYFEQGILVSFKNYFWKIYLGNQSSEQKNTYRNLEEKEWMGCWRANFIFFFHPDF